MLGVRPTLLLAQALGNFGQLGGGRDVNREHSAGISAAVTRAAPPWREHVQHHPVDLTANSATSPIRKIQFAGVPPKKRSTLRTACSA